MNIPIFQLICAFYSACFTEEWLLENLTTSSDIITHQIQKLTDVYLHFTIKNFHFSFSFLYNKQPCIHSKNLIFIYLRHEPLLQHLILHVNFVIQEIFLHTRFSSMQTLFRTYLCDVSFLKGSVSLFIRHHFTIYIFFLRTNIIK